MSLQLLDSLSLPGDPAKANEDAFGHDASAALVIDGATVLGDNLMPGPSDAAWIAQFGARRLLAHLKDGDAPQVALENALADTDKSFTALRRHPVQEKWQTPCASMMVAAETSEGIEFLWFGDCAALIGDGPSVSVIGETIAKRGQELVGRVRARNRDVTHRAAGAADQQFAIRAHPAGMQPIAMRRARASSIFRSSLCCSRLADLYSK